MVVEGGHRLFHVLCVCVCVCVSQGRDVAPLGLRPEGAINFRDCERQLYHILASRRP